MKIMASGPITSWQINGETMETVTDFIFLSSKITAVGDCSHKIKRCLLLGKKSYDKPRQCIKKQRHHFANKGPSSQSYGFSRSHVWMWQLNHKERWAPKNWCFWTVRRLLRVPWTARRSNQSILKEINPEYSLEDWCWSWSSNTLAAYCEQLTHWKDRDAGKDWRQEGKEMTENEMVRWHHRQNGYQFEQAPGGGEGKGSLACYSPWGCKGFSTWLSNWTTASVQGRASIQNI